MNAETKQANRLFDALKHSDAKIVFAESCTAGLVAATLARVPGVSDHLCGSAVTYRPETKVAWLNIDADDLAQYTAVSAPVTEAMARNVLQLTEEASIAVAVTGHLGPGAPPELDGVVYISVAQRLSSQLETQRKQLAATDRVDRQVETVQAVLAVALAAVNSL